MSVVTHRLTLWAKSSIELINTRKILDDPVRELDVDASTAACRSEGARTRFPTGLGAVWAVLGVTGGGLAARTGFLVGVCRWCSSSIKVQHFTHRK